MTQKKYEIHLSSIVALFVLGTAAFVGLGLLLRAALPEFLSRGTGMTILALVSVFAVATALFVFGFFLGYLYSKSYSGHITDKRVLQRFRDALDFERQERLRLERQLFESKKRTVSLEDRLSREGNEQKDKDELTAAEKEEREKMRIELEEHAQRQEKMRGDLNKRKERIADLMAELSMAQSDAEAARSEAEKLKASLVVPSPAFVGGHEISGSSLKEILGDILQLEGIKMALVADDYGLVVDSAGDELPSEILAAISGVIASIGPQVREMMPMGEVTTVSLSDDRGLVLDTRYFELLGSKCALAIARDSEHQYPGLTEDAVKSITDGFKE